MRGRCSSASFSDAPDLDEVEGADDPRVTLACMSLTRRRAAASTSLASTALRIWKRPASGVVGGTAESSFPSLDRGILGAVSDASAPSRVLFLFPDSSEIRYTRKPKPGDRVRSKKGIIWTVGEVMRSGIDTYTVACVAPSPGAHKLALDLLQLARESISPSRFAAADLPADQSIDVRLRSENDYGRTMLAPIDERVTDGPDPVVVTYGPDWVVVPPDVPTALDNRKDGADGREHDNSTTGAAPALAGSKRPRPPNDGTART